VGITIQQEYAAVDMPEATGNIPYVDTSLDEGGTRPVTETVQVKLRDTKPIA